MQARGMLRTVSAARYVTPLREGGSLPAIVEADDDELYVAKFRGAGQGVKALIAELVAGEIGRALGLPVPELVFIDLDKQFGRAEPHEEIQELLYRSTGLNLALAYIPGALAVDAALVPEPAKVLASHIVWFDAYTTNVDRTPRNTNMLTQNGGVWLIDHGAALFFHHTWTNYLTRAYSPFVQIKDHVLLPYANQLAQADAELSAQLTPEIINHIVAQIPDDWLQGETTFSNPDEHRAAYVEYLLNRLAAPRAFAQEAADAHARGV